MRLLVILIVMALALTASWSSAQIYVDAGATGADDGSSWTDAYVDLQDALGSASNGDQIWVAAGTYLPDPLFDRLQTFQLISGVEIYGGFAGGEVSLGQRDVDANPTILSGDIGLSIDTSDNSYHVVTGTGADATAVLDGFTITGGNANAAHHLNGGGLVVSTSNPTIANIRFFDNMSLFNGGGAYLFDSPATFTNVTFELNSASQNGGGMACLSSSPVLANAVFLDNAALSDGGGMYNNSGSNAAITNCLFYDNTANAGGAIGNSTSSPVIKNTVIWKNTATTNASINNAGISQPPIASSLIEGSGGSGTNWFGPIGMDGGGNEDRNPAFIDPVNEDFRLHIVSPGTNTGDNGATGLPAVDFAGNPRVSGGTVDMGPWEHPFVCHGGSRLYVKTVATGSGDGSSWADAMAQLRDALVVADVCGGITEIWVAAGVYKATTTNDDRSWSFGLRNGLSIYGGFLGTETSPAERDWTTNLSSLNGAIGPDNTRHMIRSEGTDATAVIDGFKVLFGDGVFAYGVSYVGGGVYNIGGSPTIRNILLFDNVNGVYNSGGSPTLKNVTFQSNSSTALRNEDGGTMVATDCVFQSNSGSSGGAVLNAASTLTLNNPTFQGNLASFGGGSFHNREGGTVTVNGGLFQASIGGAIRCRDDGGVVTVNDATFILNNGGRGGCFDGTDVYTLTMNNVLFDGNTASLTGGVLRLVGSGTATLTNVEFRGNNAGTFGGAIYTEIPLSITNGLFFGNVADDGGAVAVSVFGTAEFLNVAFSQNSASADGGAVSLGGPATFRNSILWGNAALNGPNLHPIPNTLASFEACIVEGSGGSGAWVTGFGTDLGGNLDTDPLFVNELGGDLHLTSTSLAIDAGVNAGGLPATDLDGFARVVGAFVDMGPYEYDPLVGIGDDDDVVPDHALRFATYPNPFNPTLTVAFELDRARDVTVSVYNVTGQRVRTLARESRSSGPHTLTWDATDASGNRVASGMYIIRIDAEDWRQNRKVILLK